MGSAAAFAKHYGGTLAKLKPGTKAFNDAWKKEASGKNAQKFAKAQHEYAKSVYYNPTANKFSEIVGLNVNSRSDALQQVLWSLGVQHGSGGAAKVLKAAGISKKDNDPTIIRKIYAERSKTSKYFSSSSKAVQNSVAKRFQNELKDALAMFNGTYKG